MIRKYLKIILLVWLVIIVILPQIVWAANPALNKLQEVGSDGKGPYTAATPTTLPYVIGIVVQSALAMVGAIFIVLMLYAGYNWMIARGEEEKVSKAKDTITASIIGIIIVVGAWAIWKFIFERLL